jgi:transcriptional regulator with XRE-family HTH domain
MQTKLGEFIRAHRERITPESAGLPGGGRRRTPGLRREELAQLCDVSPTWLTWLEQGREVSASGKMLARLAEVLRLSAAERAYLFSLAACAFHATAFHCRSRM